MRRDHAYQLRAQRRYNPPHPVYPPFQNLKLVRVQSQLLLSLCLEFLGWSNDILLHLLNGSLCALLRLIVEENPSTLNSADDEQAEVDSCETEDTETKVSCMFYAG